MLRLCAAVILSVFLTTAAPVLAQDEADDIPGLFNRALEALQTGDTETAYRTGQIMLAHPDFDSLPATAKADVYGLAGHATLYLPDFPVEEALEYLDEAVRLGTDAPVIYMTRGFANMSNDNPVQSARDLMQGDRLARGLLNGLRGQDFLVVIDMLAQSDQDGADEVYPLFVEYLLKRWDPENPFETNEYVRYHAARVAIDEGNLMEAGRLVESLEFAETRLRVQIERDFEPFWIEDTDALKQHIRSGAEHTIAFYGELAEQNPGFIEPVALQAQGYAMLGDPEAAMASLEAAREQALSGELINDVSEQMPWLLNDMAGAAEQLGDFDRAVELMSEAAGLSEYNSPNVSQRTNLAFMLAMDGQHDRALSEIETINFNQTSDFGKAYLLAARICTNHFRGQPSTIEDDIAALEDNGMLTAGLLQYAFACLDDRDRGAALLIERLEHPAGRVNALHELQEFLDVEGEYKGPYSAQLEAHDDALIARPDVAAAIEAAGRLIEPGVTF